MEVMDYEAGHNSPQLINHGQVGEAAPSAYRCMHRLSTLPPVGGEGPDADAVQAITPPSARSVVFGNYRLLHKLAVVRRNSMPANQQEA